MTKEFQEETTTFYTFPLLTYTKTPMDPEKFTQDTSNIHPLGSHVSYPCHLSTTECETETLGPGVRWDPPKQTGSGDGGREVPS